MSEKRFLVNYQNYANESKRFEIDSFEDLKMELSERNDYETCFYTQIWDRLTQKSKLVSNEQIMSMNYEL